MGDLATRLFHLIDRYLVLLPLLLRGLLLVLGDGGLALTTGAA